MAFTPHWSVEALETYNRLKRSAEAALEHRRKSRKSKSSKAEGLFKQVHKCITLLLENPRHPGLQTHEFHSLQHPYDRNAKVFEAYVQQKTPAAYRLFWCYGPKQGEITILSITPHP
ncbi:MAG: hypothetical protein IH895_09705 [Planctomycetes bacterium]|nr:hypothetical protein [Planctomycetota bacterium]MCH8912516.1 hypothetical protein [Planctomycetota bacterium]